MAKTRVPEADIDGQTKVGTEVASAARFHVSPLDERVLMPRFDWPICDTINACQLQSSDRNHSLKTASGRPACVGILSGGAIVKLLMPPVPTTYPDGNVRCVDS